MRLLLIRHGQSEGNASGVVQGHIDYGLTSLGRAQAEATAQRLAVEKVDRVLTSPLLRARQTAEPIARAIGAPLEPELGLREYDIGDISGMNTREIAERFPHIGEAYRAGRRPAFPGEEGRDVFYQRLLAVLERCRGSDETVVAVGHGGVVSALCYMVLGLDHARPGMLQVANCSLTELFTDRGGRLVIRHQNDTCHLRGIVTIEDAG